MSLLSVVEADSPFHLWPMLEEGGRITADVRGIPATALVAALVNPMSGFGYTGPDSSVGSCMITINPEWLTVTPDFIPIAPPFTYELWLWQHSQRNSFDLLFYQYDSSGFHGIQMDVKANNTLEAIVETTSCNGSTTLNYYQWYALAFTYDGSNIRTYINGVLDHTTALGSHTFNSQKFVIGNNSSAANYAHSFIALPAVYASALSAAQLLAHYNAADQAGSTPVYFQQGVTPTPAPFSGNDLSQVLKAVRKTFPTT